MIPKICIIGCINLKNNIFKDFTMRYLTLDEEEKIVRYWLQYLKRVRRMILKYIIGRQQNAFILII